MQASVLRIRSESCKCRFVLNVCDSHNRRSASENLSGKDSRQSRITGIRSGSFYLLISLIFYFIYSIIMKISKSLLLCLVLFGVHSVAFAQFAAATTALTQIQSVMKSLGVAIVTIAMMYVGFKMVFQAAEWKDVAPVFWGGVLIGGAATVAGMLGVS